MRLANPINALCAASALLASGTTDVRADVFGDHCATFTSTHGVQEDWRDLGNGFVGYYQRSFAILLKAIDPKTGKSMRGDPAGQYRDLTVESCVSGRKISVPTFACESWDDPGCSGSEITLNIEPLAQKLLDEVVSPATSVTFDQLVERFRAISGKVRVVEADGQETCACQAAYPKLRGNKSKYEYHSAY